MQKFMPEQVFSHIHSLGRKKKKKDIRRCTNKLKILSCTVPIDFFKEKQVIHIGTALRANYCQQGMQKFIPAQGRKDQKILVG